MKNDKREESRVLLENYKHLLQKALDWLWERIKVERGEIRRDKKTFTKITLPENGRPKITSLKINLYYSSYGNLREVIPGTRY